MECVGKTTESTSLTLVLMVRNVVTSVYTEKNIQRR